MAPGIHDPVHPARIPLFHPNLITSDMDELKFHAAASLQLRFSPHPPEEEEQPLLITSPYNCAPHLLDLRILDPADQLLATALTVLRPVCADYATAAYAESFNWATVVAILRDLVNRDGYIWRRRRFYVVVFRSTLLAGADGARLHELDERSHQEAVVSGGLLKYWFGTKNARRENLATCIWRSREDAQKGGSGPWHRKARGAAREMYERIAFTTMELVIGDEVGEWSIGEWTMFLTRQRIYHRCPTGI